MFYCMFYFTCDRSYRTISAMEADALRPSAVYDGGLVGAGAEARQALLHRHRTSTDDERRLTRSNSVPDSLQDRAPQIQALSSRQFNSISNNASDVDSQQTKV